LDPAEPLAPQPQPQNLTNLEHWNLPERHRHLPGPLNGTGGECTLSDTSTGGPRVVPSLAEGWSHARGGTTSQVVPCPWRATPRSIETETTTRLRLGAAGHRLVTNDD